MENGSSFKNSSILPEIRSACKPTLLVQLEPWHVAFVNNLCDLLLGRTVAEDSEYSPTAFWPDVFVAAPLPWRRFFESGTYHCLLIVIMWGVPQILSREARPEVHSPFDRSSVIYYTASEYLRPVDTGGRVGENSGTGADCGDGSSFRSTCFTESYDSCGGAISRAERCSTSPRSQSFTTRDRSTATNYGHAVIAPNHTSTCSSDHRASTTNRRRFHQGGRRPQYWPHRRYRSCATVTPCSTAQLSNADSDRSGDTENRGCASAAVTQVNRTF